jgi:hypothetical protein
MARYDPETLIVLRNALDEAWALLPDDRKSEGQKSDMALRILEKAAEGVPSDFEPLPLVSNDRSIIFAHKSD